MASTNEAVSVPVPSLSTLIKTTQDGRRVAVIGQAIYLGDKKEAEILVPVEKHPNREAILQAVPEATHMAGRVPLLAEEAKLAVTAMLSAKRSYENSAAGLAERLRQAPKDMLRLRIDE